MRRHDRWIELAQQLHLRPSIVVASCYFLNKGWSPARVAIALDVSVSVVQRIADAARPFLRYRDTRARSTKDLIANRDGDRCHYCGTGHSLQIDHIYPKSRGGSSDAENLVLACRNCNASKGDRTPEEWLG